MANTDGAKIRKLTMPNGFNVFFLDVGYSKQHLRERFEGHITHQYMVWLSN
jgi:hypothetical protein